MAPRKGRRVPSSFRRPDPSFLSISPRRRPGRNIFSCGLTTTPATLCCRAVATTTAGDRMDVWGALQLVGSGLSLVACAVAAILLAYRARLTQRAEIIKSAPENDRLEAIATTAEFFRVDVSRLSRAQQEGIVLARAIRSWQRRLAARPL